MGLKDKVAGCLLAAAVVAGVVPATSTAAAAAASAIAGHAKPFISWFSAGSCR